MTEATNWRTNGVKIVRAETLRKAMLAPPAAGRATAFDFTGFGGQQTWIGTVTLQPQAMTGPHHHGRHEVAVYVAKGRGQVRWGEQLEFAAEVGPGDFVYFAPYVPHQEVNNADETLDFVVVRSDGERIAVGLDIAPAKNPEHVEIL
jgi:uncharacterized RmlC-like cupin family protein